jgi:hypothetical protein
VSEIGHNNPPAFDAFSLALDDAYDTAKDFLDGAPIENQGQADAVGRIVGEVKKIKKDADEARKDEKRPHDEAAAAVQAKWKPLLDRAETILAAAQKPLTAYLNKLAEEQREAERIAREEAARKAQEAIEASRQAEGLDAIERARELEKEADKAAKEAARSGKAKAHVTGADRAIGLRTYKVATVEDYPALLRHIKQTDPGALRAWLDEYARKALPMQLPGVNVTTERKVA